jgi:uncharacterized protein HemY
LSEQTLPDHVSLVGEAWEMRGKIRAAADAGDAAEVARLLHRCRELEDDLFAVEITDVRHARAQRGRGGGFNPSLEQAEHKLSERLARLGVPTHQQPWRG